MKVVTLVRHAKSSWKDRTLPDHLRPLNKRGKRDAPMMGERLAERGVEVDQMISSPATRAKTTAEAVAEEIGYPWEEIVVDERLYHGEVFELLQVIQGLEDYVHHVMLFGHNPGLTELTNYLSPYYIDNVPTCGVVELRYDTDTWACPGEVEPTEVHFDYPKKRDT